MTSLKAISDSLVSLEWVSNMRAPLSWIKEFVEIPDSITPEQISDGLIRVGFEVEEIIVQGSRSHWTSGFCKGIKHRGAHRV
jgi:hypothetical protein